MMRKTLTSLVLAAALSTSASWAVGPIDFNADFTNTGWWTAYDIALVLAGNEQIDGTYDGEAPKYLHFRNFCRTTDGSTTTLHWQAPWDETTNTPGAITPGKTIHVGYSTPDNTSTILDAYWTDVYGGRIPGGGIAITAAHIDQAGVTISNSFKDRISISNLSYNLYPTRLDLRQLVGANQALMADLRPLGGPAVLSIDPGQSLRFDFPSPVPPGYAAVVVFNQGGATSTANALSFTQAVPGQGAPVDAVP
jgi:hypothetical protein